MSTTHRVWQAMARAEIAHGGPRTMTSSDICRALGLTVTTPTINRALRALRDIGVVRIVEGRPNGYRLWQLDAPGRAKYGLPSTHSPKGMHHEHG